MLDAAGTVAGELIAAQSQLEGLRQIYTDNNSRVRAMQGRVAELRRQLEKLGGTQVNSAKNLAASNSAKSQAAGPPAGKQLILPLMSPLTEQLRNRGACLIPQSGACHFLEQNTAIITAEQKYKKPFTSY